MTSSFPTPIQDIALNLIFRVMGERRCNRTREEYAAIAAKLPPLKVLVFKINEELALMHSRSIRSGVRLPQVCRFQAGDERWEWEDYPHKISHGTVRAALNVSGLRRPRWHKPLE
jgi:hypothetical protein